MHDCSIKVYNFWNINSFFARITNFLCDTNLIIVLLVIHACFFNQYIEGFADFYSECNLTELMEKAMKNVGINKGEKEVEYYFCK